MKLEYRGATIALEVGDITKGGVDVIVNAANGQLAGGGGVDGAIHRAAGPSLLEECKKAHAEHGGDLAAGEAVMTGAGDLPAKHVIHAVGPVWQGGGFGELLALEQVHTTSLTLAAKAGATSIALAAISTGAYGFPADRAAFVAANATARFLEGKPGDLLDIRYVLFTESAYGVFKDAFEEVIQTMTGS